MPWPPKIAHAKPHERPNPFDAWWFQQQSELIPDFPLGTELLHHYCQNDPNKFERLNKYLEAAFNAGVEYGKKAK